MITIQMTKKNCILCNGSGWITPYRKKCDHTYSRDTFFTRYNNAKKRLQKAKNHFKKLEIALDTEVI